MPELPEVEALADHLRGHAVGRTIGRVDVVAFSALKTFDPPITALHGLTVTGADRWGKYLGLQAGELILITDLSRAGWLRWSDRLAAAPLRPAKARLRCAFISALPARRPASTSPRRAPRSGWRCGSSTTRSRCPASPRSGRRTAIVGRRLGRGAGRKHRPDQVRHHRPEGDRRDW